MPFFETNDGVRLAYEDYGQGEPIVFLASWVLSADMWEYQVPYFLERGYRCVMLDRRGHGRSDRPSTGYDVDTRADDVAALVEHLGLDGVTLVGQSGGGGEAVRYLARHGQDRIARVALLSTTLPFLKLTDDNPEGVPEESLEADLAQLRADRAKWFADRAQGYFATHLGNSVSQAMIDHMLRQCLSPSFYVTVEMQRQLFNADHRADLAQITIPTFIAHGIADQSVPVDVSSRRTAKLVPHSVYKEYATAGHGLHITHAEQLNNDLLEFIKS
jgi:non-heme chloroperoxidase